MRKRPNQSVVLAGAGAVVRVEYYNNYDLRAELNSIVDDM